MDYIFIVIILWAICLLICLSYALAKDEIAIFIVGMFPIINVIYVIYLICNIRKIISFKNLINKLKV